MKLIIEIDNVSSGVSAESCGNCPARVGNPPHCRIFDQRLADTFEGYIWMVYRCTKCREAELRDEI